MGQLLPVTTSDPLLRRIIETINELLLGRVQIQKLTLLDGGAIPTVTSGEAVIYIDRADGDLKIKFGDGTVKTIVVDT